jgi:hypothetical protein
MASDPKPAPAAPFRKDNGKWTYYVYPKGSAEEGGEFPDENAATESFIKMYRLWEVNGQSYHGNIAILN